MRRILTITVWFVFFIFVAFSSTLAMPQQGVKQAEIRTPKPPATPRINGPPAYGVRPGSPFLFLISATGERPMEFSVDGLPAGLSVNPRTGLITGSLKK